ncbi:hypothetical protein GY50_0898 [Dehalococcoides mccartyi GY50]|nr:hypothetical protein GY50_0898 [Dehalococcoides mccartyi GY50]
MDQYFLHSITLQDLYIFFGKFHAIAINQAASLIEQVLPEDHSGFQHIQM